MTVSASFIAKNSNKSCRSVPVESFLTPPRVFLCVVHGIGGNNEKGGRQSNHLQLPSVGHLRGSRRCPCSASHVGRRRGARVPARPRAPRRVRATSAARPRALRRASARLRCTSSRSTFARARARRRRLLPFTRARPPSHDRRSSTAGRHRRTASARRRRRARPSRASSSGRHHRARPSRASSSGRRRRECPRAPTLSRDSACPRVGLRLGLLCTRSPDRGPSGASHPPPPPPPLPRPSSVASPSRATNSVRRQRRRHTQRTGPITSGRPSRTRAGSSHSVSLHWTSSAPKCWTPLGSCCRIASGQGRPACPSRCR